jgi:ABC-type transport system involved in multi-copper enzyme maturation permease subunit
MTELTTTPAPPSRNPLRGLWRNPVTMKELRSRMRGRRAFAVLTLYLLLLSGVVSLVYLTISASSTFPGGTATYSAGKAVFAAVVAVQVVLVTFIGPAFTAGAISGERERQTFDLLRTTLLSAHAFVLGKLVSALSYIFLLVLVSIPIQSIAFLLGGLSLVELLLSQLVILVAAVTYALYGLWCSAVMRSTLTATVATFGGMLVLVFVVPMLAMFFLLGLSIPLSSSGSPSPVLEVLLVYAAIALAATNLPVSLIASEVILLQMDALFAFNEFIGSQSLWIASPWWLFILLHVVAALLLYRATVWRVRRVSDV